MESEVLVGLLVRLLPAIIVVVLAFVAAADRKTRERWCDLLHQVGSIRADQREDVQIGRGVKWPFFVVALCLMVWPVQYYRHSSQKIEPENADLYKEKSPTSDLTKKEEAPKDAPAPTPTRTPGPEVAPIPGATQAPAAQAPATSTSGATSTSQPATGSPKSDLYTKPKAAPG